MFIHLEARQMNLHMDIDKCEEDDGIVYISTYGFIELWINVKIVQYLSLFDDGECTLLIKNGEILKEKTK